MSWKEMIECACGCGEMIHKIDSRGRPRRYKARHMKGIGKGKFIPIETRIKMSRARKNLYKDINILQY